MLTDAYPHINIQLKTIIIFGLIQPIVRARQMISAPRFPVYQASSDVQLPIVQYRRLAVGASESASETR